MGKITERGFYPPSGLIQKSRENWDKQGKLKGKGIRDL
jgi:hypothetical protein